MANNKNNGVASMYYYVKNPGQTTDEDQDKKIVGIALPVFVVVILLLKIFCSFVEKARGEQNAGGGDRVHQQRQSREAGSLVDTAPSSPVAGAAPVLEVAAVQAAEPPLVCTYREADGWRDGSCGVCLAEMADGDVLRVLPACMHYFHATCVGEWLRAHATCPLCRAPLVAPAAAAAQF